MRTLLVIIAFAFSIQGMCDDAAKGDKWKGHRDKAVAKMTERKAMIQSHIDCMTGATTRDAFKACKETMKKNREAFKAKHPKKSKI